MIEPEASPRTHSTQPVSTGSPTAYPQQQTSCTCDSVQQVSEDGVDATDEETSIKAPVIAVSVTTSGEDEMHETARTSPEASLTELVKQEGPYSSRTVAQKPRVQTEKLYPHPHDPLVVIAIVTIPKPDGSGYSIQEDIIPELVSAPIDTENTSNSYILPDPSTRKVPRKIRESKHRDVPLWAPNSDDSWTRKSNVKDGEEIIKTFRPTFCLRRFNSLSHEYEAVYTGEKKLGNVDPNDKKWVVNYNKWLDQVRRRNDSNYIKELSRDHWTPAEMREFYAAVNKLCHSKGLRIFGVGKDSDMVHADYKSIADAVNATKNGSRNVDAVRGKIFSAHEKKDLPLLILRRQAAALREEINDGAILADAELFPRFAIPLEDFPADIPPKDRKGKKPATATDEELNPVDTELEDQAGESIIAVRAASAEEESHLAPSDPDTESDDADNIDATPSNTHTVPLRKQAKASRNQVSTSLESFPSIPTHSSSLATRAHPPQTTTPSHHSLKRKQSSHENTHNTQSLNTNNAHTTSTTHRHAPQPHTRPRPSKRAKHSSDPAHPKHEY
ncbi:hypothetical protein ACN47E_002155 [Coniothyrium glycines]